GYNTPFRIKATATGLNELTLETRNLANPTWVNTKVAALNIAGFNQVKFYSGGLSEANDNHGLFMNNFAVIPEPTSLSLFALGATGLLALRRRRNA
ncbi:MAG: PEP-CTERM sorting domain-containing protein, partial [Verrucomicrobiota bacterium]